METIGILTHCVANNYGANLQALSTAYFLKKLGYRPYFLLWNKYLIERNKIMNKDQLVIHSNFLKNLGFELSLPCVTDSDFINTIQTQNIRNVLVGSDAVLTVKSILDRIIINRHGIKLQKVQADQTFPNPFWLSFAKNNINCKFFLLSPSSQSTSYEFLSYDVKKKMAVQLSKFSYLSARDKHTQNMIKSIIGSNINVPITPDPVFGFNHNVPNNIIPSKQYILSKFNLNENYYLISFYKGNSMSKEWINSLHKKIKTDGDELYPLPMPQGMFENDLSKNIDLPINALEWYALIKYSKGYIGNNMHPIIVAIHNQIPFFSIDHHGRKILCFKFEKTSKVYDLLKRWGLLEYRIGDKHKSNISSDIVFQKLKSFNISHCRYVADNLYMLYSKMMNEISAQF